MVVMSRLAPPSVSGNPHLEQLTRTNIALDVDTFSTCHWSKECISCLQLAKSNSVNYLLETCLILNLNVKLFIHVGYRTVVWKILNLFILPAFVQTDAIKQVVLLRSQALKKYTEPDQTRPGQDLT